MYGLIEAGGTKFVLAQADAQGNLHNITTIPTQTPDLTLPQIYNYFRKVKLHGLSLACFGPLELNRDLPTYGYITDTPKVAWRNCPIVPNLAEQLPIDSLIFDTDVNFAALGEYYFGRGEGSLSTLYLTVGTGVGGGFVQDNNIFKGVSHPEMGHVLVKPCPGDDFAGCCPYHHNCLEGMASGPAIMHRYGCQATELGTNHVVWSYIADYLAQALLTYTVVLRPERICLGGGVMQNPALLPQVQERFTAYAGNYLPLPPAATYITLPKLNGRSALYGCLAGLLPAEKISNLQAQLAKSAKADE